MRPRVLITDGGRALVEILGEELERAHYVAMIPGSEQALRAFSLHRERLEPLTHMGLPDARSIERALDKHLLLDEAARHGLDAPVSRICAMPGDLVACAEEVGYPLLVKPARSVHVAGTWRQQQSVLARAPADFQSASASMAPPYTLQRFHEGAPVVEVGGVIDEGELLATAVARYARTWPPAAGSASASITIVPPDGLVERSLALLRAIGWRGIFDLEFVELPGGRYATIDLNPRVYGSMSLTIAAGANLPGVWVAVLEGRRPRPVVARSGVHYRWEEGEVRAVLRAALGGRARALMGIVRPRRDTVWALSRPTDPGPLLARGLAAGRLHAPPVLKRRSSPADA